MLPRGVGELYEEVKGIYIYIGDTLLHRPSLTIYNDSEIGKFWKHLHALTKL